MRLTIALCVVCVLYSTASALEVIPGSAVTIRSALVAPLDVEVQLPVGFTNTVSVETSPEPLFPDSPVDQRYMNRYLSWQTRTSEDGTHVLHIQSQMGFLEPVIELMISEGKPGDAGRRAIVVIAPEFPGDVASGSTPGILASPPKGETTTARLRRGQLATSQESTLTPSNASTSSAYGMKASEAKSSKHGMKASEGRSSEHGMKASEAQSSEHGMKASEGKSSEHGMKASEAQSSEHGMKASEGKIKDHGMEASSSATVPAFGIPASEKTVTN